MPRGLASRPGIWPILSLSLVLLIGLGAGLVTTFVVPAGVAADEPAHWLNLLFYSAHHAMPVLGTAGTSYEAQQPPLAYASGALIESLIHSSFGTEAAFRATRIFCGLELLVAGFFAARSLRHLIDDSWAIATAVTCLLCAPMFAAMSWSVENDALVLALIFLVIDFALSRMVDRARAVDGMLAGVLVGCGLLTKFTMWPLVICVPVWLLARHGRRSLWCVASFVVGVLAVSGWWFARNVSLYGVLIPSSSLQGGLKFPAPGLHGLSTVGHLVEELVTYMWLPTELYRNSISAAVPEKAVLLLLTASIAIYSLRRLRRSAQLPPMGMRKRLATPIGLVVLTGAVAVAAWIYQAVWVTAAAPRLAYADLPLWLFAIADTVASTRRGARVAMIVGCAALLIALNVLTLTSVAQVRGRFELAL